MFQYFPHFLPTSIVVIGAGGTGSRLMAPLVQLVKTCLRKHNPAAMLERCDVYVIDGDVVENKNLTRQHFITPDVGRNKAVVVAERYARAYGINVIPCDKFLTTTTSETFDGPAGPISFRTIFQNAVVVFAVDSAKARREILAFMNRFCTSNLFVVDAGNEDDFGQVKFFTGHFLYQDRKLKHTLDGLPKHCPSTIMTSFIPFDFEYYRNLGESAIERSCEELPQTLAINAMMATMMLCVIQNFMQMRPMNYDGMSYSLKGGAGTSWNTPQSWERRIISWADRTSEIVNFMASSKDSRVPAGTAFNPVGVESGDIFYKLRQQCEKDFKAAGMKLLITGEVEPIAPPPPPVLKAKPAVKKVEKKIIVEDIDELDIPAAPPLVAAPIPMAPTLTVTAAPQAFVTTTATNVVV